MRLIKLEILLPSVLMGIVSISLAYWIAGWNTFSENLIDINIPDLFLSPSLQAWHG